MTDLGSLEIAFAENQEIFSPGDTLRGIVILNVNRKMAVKGLRVIIYGRAEVSMFVGDYDTEREQYIKKNTVLMGSSPHEQSPMISVDPGHYEYPFQFALPRALPYSFHVKGDEYGIVKYSAMAILHVPIGQPYFREKFFRVRGLLDLSTVPDSKEIGSERREMSLKYFCCTYGTITATLSVARSGYMPGETIDVFAEIVNGSSKRIKETQVSLLQLVVLRVHGSWAFRTQVVCCNKHGPVLPRAREVWTAERLAIPLNLPPSFLRGCHLMDVYYQLRLDVVPAGCSTKLIVPLNVILGTSSVTEEEDEEEPQTVSRPTLEAQNQRTSSTWEYGTWV